MITVLSLNTAIDRVLVVPGFEPGRVYRAERAHPYAGGKGLNVVRALYRLGAAVRVIGFLGGSPKPFVEERCTAMGVGQHWVETAGESRTCAIIVDPGSGEQTVVNEPGPTVADADLERLRSVLQAATVSGDVLCISGSAPPGAPDGLYAEIVRSMHDRGVRVLADVSGAVLRLTLDAHPWAVAPNLDECVAAFSDVDRSRVTPADMAKRLVEHAELALLTLGREGLVVADGRHAWLLHPPPVETVNAVGSGDAFVAGFLAGIARDLSPLDAARLGVACGASNAARLEPDIGTPDEVETLAAAVTVEPV